MPSAANLEGEAVADRGGTTAPLGSQGSGEATQAGPGLFGDIEGERLFQQIRARMFSPSAALRVGRYRILRRLGAGAMGEVHLAVDEELDRPIAIKFVHAQLASRRSTDRLRLEARALARLAHPNVVHVYDVGDFQGRVYLAMEYVEGQSLREWISEHAPSWREVLAAYVDAGRGLIAAHSAGIVHRDFKPDNVLRGSDGRVAVADFGLAALEQGAELDDEEPDDHAAAPVHSLSGEVKGTPAYMPPEQFLGRSDARADQFAFCVSLYEGLWGRRPFPRHEFQAALAGEVDWRPLPPPRKGDVPGWVWPLLRRGLAKDPEARWSGIDELLAAIEQRLLARRRRARVLVSGVAALCVGVASAVAVGWWKAGDEVDACALLDRELAGTWDEDQRARLVEQFASVAATPDNAWLADAEVPVVAGLDRWRARWLRSRLELCRARVGGDPVVLDRFGACLEGQRRSTQALVELLVVGGAETLRDAPESVQGLGDPRRCASEARQGGPPEPPEGIAEEVEQIRGELAELEAELSMDHFDVVLAETETLDARAGTLGYAPLQAEVTYLRGRALLRSEPEQGFELLEQTVDLAEGARHDRLVADAWRTMAMTAATDLPNLERGRRWLRRADATATRIGGEPLTSGRLDYIRGNLYLLANDSKTAAKHFESALVVLEGHGDTLYVAHTTSSLGIAMLGLGMDDRALELFERALELSREVYGARHPEVAAAAYDLGQVALDSDHMQLGRRMLEQAVAVWTEAPTTNPLDAGRAQLVLAQFALMEGRNQAALDLASAAALAFERTPVASPAEHAEAARLVGASHYFMAEFEPAILAYRRAVAGYTEAHGADDLYTAYFRVALGWALLAVDDIDDAEHEFESSLAIITAKAAPTDAIDVRFGLVGVDLARGNHTSARARLAEIDPEQLADLELLEYELFNGLLLRRLDRDDPEADAALDRARTQAQQAINGEATLTVLLDSIGASPDERRLLTE